MIKKIGYIVLDERGPLCSVPGYKARGRTINVLMHGAGYCEVFEDRAKIKGLITNTLKFVSVNGYKWSTNYRIIRLRKPTP